MQMMGSKLKLEILSPEPTDLGVGSSNLSGRANEIKGLEENHENRISLGFPWGSWVTCTAEDRDGSYCSLFSVFHRQH